MEGGRRGVPSVEAVLPVLIGEAPSKAGDRFHNLPLSGPPARVLCRLAGIPAQDEGSPWGQWTWALYEHFECCNLIKRYKDAEPWSVPRARVRAVQLLQKEDLGRRIVVLLGARVAAAFGHQDKTGWFMWHEHPFEHVVIPHPSGRNRALQVPAVRALTGDALRHAMERAASR